MRGHCAPPSGRGSARALALRGRTCAPPLRRSLRRKAFRATLCVSHSRRRRSPSIPNLTINSATWRLSTPRSLPELIHTRVKCILSVSSVSCAQNSLETGAADVNVELASSSDQKHSQGAAALRRSLSRRVALMRTRACAALCRVVLALGWNSRVSLSLLASLENRHRRTSRACTVTRAHARERDVSSLCGARCPGVWRSCAPELAPRCAAWLVLGWNSRVSLSLLASLETRHRRTSRACTVTRAHARKRDVPCTAAGSGTRPHVLAKEWRSAVEFRPAHVHVPAQSSSAHGHCPEIRETLAHSCSRARRLWRSRLGSFQREEQQKRENAC